MGNIMKFYEMEANTPYRMSVLVKGMADKFTRNGDPYVALEIFDGVKTVKTNLWNHTTTMLETAGVVQGTILQVTLAATARDGGSGCFYNMDSNDWKVNDDPDITEGNFVHKAPWDPDEMFAWILEKVRSVNSNPNNEGPYKSLAHLTELLLTQNEEAFKRSSAAVSMHHNFLAGLIYHTTRMISVAETVCWTYKYLDRELLICATALHDIGKVSCYETMDVGEATVTVEGRLLDHALVGTMMIHDAAARDLYHPEKIQMLEHMIASHHGKKEWDAITTPAFPEAEMLHLIDMMDSRMNMFEEAYKGQAAGTVSDEKVYGLENSYIYKPLYPEA